MLKFIRNFIYILRNPPDPNWHILKTAKPKPSYPLGGFWKANTNHLHGLAIGAAKGGKYFVCFCGPSGCFAKGTYRPNTPIDGDPDYRVINNDTIEVKGRRGFTKYVRSENTLHT